MTLFGYTIEIPGKLPMKARPALAPRYHQILIDIQPGDQARIRGFASTLSAERRAHLQSYGLVPGRLVRVVQHSPVTILQVEHCELALEDDLARLVEIETL